MMFTEAEEARQQTRERLDKLRRRLKDLQRTRGELKARLLDNRRTRAAVQTQIWRLSNPEKVARYSEKSQNRRNAALALANKPKRGRPPGRITGLNRLAEVDRELLAFPSPAVERALLNERRRLHEKLRIIPAPVEATPEMVLPETPPLPLEAPANKPFDPTEYFGADFVKQFAKPQDIVDNG